MIIVASLEAVALVAVVYLLLRDHARSETAVAEERTASAVRHYESEVRWQEERAELLNRVQAPERLPVREMPELVIPDREPDEWATVGRVDIDPKYGLGDD